VSGLKIGPVNRLPEELSISLHHNVTSLRIKLKARTPNPQNPSSDIILGQTRAPEGCVPIPQILTQYKSSYVKKAATKEVITPE